MPYLSPQTLTHDEQRIVLRAVAAHPRDHAIISLALGTGHTATWTGNAMIVWGGFFGASPTTPIGTGAVYNPAADSWTAISTGTGAPAARGYHVAVWTGSEMIVWGGFGAYINYNSGGRYNPVLDSWTPTSTWPAPPAGGNYTVVWTGTEMILWGSDGGVTPVGGRYNPSTDSWSALGHDANEPESREFHTAVWTGTEMIIWGGYPFLYAEGGRYSPITNSWSRLSTLGQPYPRQFHTAVWTGNEMIVWGGENCHGSCPGLSNTGGRYDPTTDSWVPTASEVTVPGARTGHTAVWTGTEMIAWGGISGSSTQAVLNTGGRYSAATDSWAPTSVGASVPIARNAHSAVWTGTEMIVWGGRPAGPDLPLNDGGRYNPVTNRWTPTSTGTDAPIARFQHTAVWTGADMVVWGGVNFTFCCDTILNTGARYSPTTDRWVPTTAVGIVPTPRFAHRAIWTGTEMIVWGGYDSHSALNTGGRYAPASNSWTLTSTAAAVPEPRVNFTAVWTGTEMVIWGGSSGSSNSRMNTGGRYDPSTNTWTPTSMGPNVPSARYLHTALWTGKEMIVWGGTMYVGPGALNTGGRYDVATDSWSATTMTNAPPARDAHTAVWSGNEMIIWGGTPPFSSAGRYCACPAGQLVYRDADGDGYGDARIGMPSCDGTVPPGYVSVGLDCDDSNPAVHTGAIETCNGIDDDCNGLVDESVSGDDTDADRIHDLCDNCSLDFNPSQSDLDHDGEGDICDLNDGLIYIYSTDKNHREWQSETGYTSWNGYRGSLAVLRATGQYTQAPGSNPLASHDCGLIDPYVVDLDVPAPGEVAFNLVTGVAGGVESSLGTNSAGSQRPNANPCP